MLLALIVVSLNWIVKDVAFGTGGYLVFLNYFKFCRLSYFFINMKACGENARKQIIIWEEVTIK